jgi:hypothetical protein
MKTLILNLLLLSLISTAVHAQENTAQLEAVQFFQDYVADYNDYLANGNPSAVTEVTQHFHMPLLQFPKSGAIALNSREQLGKNLKSFLDGLKSKGVQRIVWQKIQAHQLDEDTIIANNVANAILSNGKVAKQLAAFYILNKSEGEWRIVSLKQHPLENLLQVH